MTCRIFTLVSKDQFISNNYCHLLEIVTVIVVKYSYSIIIKYYYYDSAII